MKLWQLVRLKSSNPANRLRVVEEVCRSHQPGGAEILLAAVQDEDEEVRKAAIKGLSAVRDPRTAPRLLEALGDAQGNVRAEAARALGILGDMDSQQALVPLLRDQDIAVRRAAATALENLRWRPANEDQRALLALAAGRYQEAVRESTSILDLLLMELKEASSSKRKELVDVLSEIPEDRTQDTIFLLKDPDANVRVAAIHGLAKKGPERFLDWLLQALQDPDWHVRLTSLEILGNLARYELWQYFAGMLNDQNWEVRSAAVRALGKVNDPVVVEPLLPMLQDRDTDVRNATAEMLGLVMDPRATAPLIGTLADAERAVRQTAASALERIDPNWEKSEAAQQAVPRLEAALNNTEYWVRVAATEALARIRGDLIDLPPEQLLQQKQETQFLTKIRLV